MNNLLRHANKFTAIGSWLDIKRVLRPNSPIKSWVTDRRVDKFTAMRTRAIGSTGAKLPSLQPGPGFAGGDALYFVTLYTDFVEKKW